MEEEGIIRLGPSDKPLHASNDIPSGGERPRINCVICQQNYVLWGISVLYEQKYQKTLQYLSTHKTLTDQELPDAFRVVYAAPQLVF